MIWQSVSPRLPVVTASLRIASTTSLRVLGEPDRILFLGPDRYGIPLEVVALELANGDLLVIHAMRMRRKYRDHYLKVLRWQEPR